MNPKEFLSRPGTNLSEDWMVLFFVLMVGLIAWIRTSYPQHFRQLFNSAASERMMRQLMREETSTKRENLLFFLNFFLSSGMMLYLAGKYYGWQTTSVEGVGLYLLYFLGLLAYYAVKSALIYIVRFISDGDYGLEEYHYNLFLMNRINGIFMVPLAISGAYLDLDRVPWVLITGLIILGIFTFFGLFRGVIGALRNGVEVFYIFFYICTLEILPLLLLYKALAR